MSVDWDTIYFGEEDDGEYIAEILFDHFGEENNTSAPTKTTAPTTKKTTTKPCNALNKLYILIIYNFVIYASTQFIKILSHFINEFQNRY